MTTADLDGGEPRGRARPYHRPGRPPGASNSHESAERAAAVFYGASLLAIALLFSALWGTVALDRELLKPEVTDQEVTAILVATSPSIGFYAGAIAVAIVAPRVAAFGYLAIAVVGVLRVRGDEPAIEAS